MEGIAWILACAYLIVGCTYYCFSINRIVSFIKTMNGNAADAVALIIVLMALIIAWPYLLWLDVKDVVEKPYEYNIDD